MTLYGACTLWLPKGLSNFGGSAVCWGTVLTVSQRWPTMSIVIILTGTLNSIAKATTKMTYGRRALEADSYLLAYLLSALIYVWITGFIFITRLVASYNLKEGEWIEDRGMQFTYSWNCLLVSLNTIVHNSRDWHENLWLLNILHFKTLFNFKVIS